jgi:small-conductance mechanosensitive channel
MRTTRMVTWNNTWIIIPNQNVINEVLVNHSTNGSIRIEIPISMLTTADVPTTRQAIVDLVLNVEGVRATPAPTVVVRSLDMARTTLMIHAWVATGEDEMPVQYRILEAVKPLLQRSLERERSAS